MKKKKILMAVGGSGGHILPAEQLRKQLEGKAEVLLAGLGLSKNPFLEKETKVCDIAAGPWGSLRFFFQSIKGICKALWLMRQFKPDLVVGFGSYHTFPVLCAAFLLRKKICLFEANCTLGKVNRLFSPCAHLVATQFIPTEESSKSVLVSPLPWIEKEKVSKQEALAYFGLDSQRTTILVFGGSQGASFLNERIPRAVSYLQDVQVIHCSGKGNFPAYGCPASVKEFEKRMDLAYIAADLVVSRSGAGTIAELLYYQKPALLIPFPKSTENHQLANGRFFVERVSGGVLVEQSHATLENLVKALKSLLEELREKERALAQWSVGKRMGFADLLLKE